MPRNRPSGAPQGPGRAVLGLGEGSPHLRLVAARYGPQAPGLRPCPLIVCAGWLPTCTSAQPPAACRGKRASCGHGRPTGHGPQRGSPHFFEPGVRAGGAMASEPKWEKWRRMDCAPLYKLVALLVRLDPDSIGFEDVDHSLDEKRFRIRDERFIDYLEMAEASVSAGALACRVTNLFHRAGMDEVLMSEFLSWARSKELPIPPELEPLERTGPASTGAAASSQIKGIKEFMKFCEVRGLKFGSERAARAFIETAEIKPIDDHAKKGRRIYDAAAVEPKVLAESERRKNWPK